MEDNIFNDIEKINNVTNRRQYFRLQTSRTLCSTLSIHSIDGKIIKGQKTKVCINNISAGGMSFITTLNLPLVNNYTLLLQFTLLDQPFKIEAVVVRKQKCEMYQKYDLKEYGVTFVTSSLVRNDLVKIINRMELLLSKCNLPYSKCSLCDQKIEKGCFRK